MAPLTRGRSEQPGDVPGDLMVEYYGQRASKGGLIISEATAVAITGRGWFGAPGMYADEQVAGWSRVTEVVHGTGGYIFSQLWHVGRSSHVEMIEGNQRCPCLLRSIRNTGWTRRPASLRASAGGPNPLRIGRSTSQRYRASSSRIARRPSARSPRALTASNCTPQTAISPISSCRTVATIAPDAYGGSIENRARFPLEIVEAMVSVWGAEQLGVRIGPGGTWNGMSDSNPTALFDHVAAELNRFGLALVCTLIEPRVKGNVVIGDGLGASSRHSTCVRFSRARSSRRADSTPKALLRPSSRKGTPIWSRSDALLPGKSGFAQAGSCWGLPLNRYVRETFYTRARQRLHRLSVLRRLSDSEFHESRSPELGTEQV